MSLNGNIQFAVAPGTTLTNAILLSTSDKLGVVNFLVQNQVEKAHQGFGVRAGAAIKVQPFESKDGKTFTAIGTPTVVNPGGEKTITITSNKRFLMIKAAGNAAGFKGSFARADFQFKGAVMRGDIGIDLFGKRGLGKDYDSAHTAETLPGNWP